MSVHDDVVALAGTCSNPVCETCPPAEEDLSDAAVEGRDPERSPGDSAVDAPVLPPPEPPPLAPGETATLIGTSLLGDTYSEETGEVLKDAPGWDPETKRILNNDGCNFFGGLLRETREAMAENERLAAPEIQALERKLEVARLRLARAQKPLESRSAWLEGVIRAYADQHRAEVLRGQRMGAKSRTFPSGLRLAWKSGGGEYRWSQDMKPAEREAALLAWAQRQDRALRFVEMRAVPATERIKGVLEQRRKAADPDLPAEAPGLEYVPEHERLDVTVENDK